MNGSKYRQPIKALLDGSLSVVESAPFDGIFKFSCPPSKAEPHHFARFLVDKDEKMAAQSDGVFIFGMLQFLWLICFQTASDRLVPSEKVIPVQILLSG